MTETKNGVDFLTLILFRKYKEDVLKILIDSGCHLIDVVYAKGAVHTVYFRDMLGLVPEEKRVMITCLVAGNLTGKLLERLNSHINFDMPNTGIAFVVPVEKLSV